MNSWCSRKKRSWRCDARNVDDAARGRSAAIAGRCPPDAGRSASAVPGAGRRHVACPARARDSGGAAGTHRRLRQLRAARIAMDTIAHLPPGVELDPARMPRHIAIIMDGNRRWAKARRMPFIEGHRRGIVALREITRAASDWRIPLLTVFGFSTENWKRDSTEISLLLDLCVYFAENELAELHRNNVRVHVIGRYELLPRASREALDRLQARTALNTGLVLNLAVNYSARTEMRDAVRALARDVRNGVLGPDDISEERLASYLYTSRMPDPDILIL